MIFDLDGVLVDSEPISARIMAEAMVAEGIPFTVEDAYEQCLGRSLATNRAALERRYGRDLSAVFSTAMRGRLFDAFRSELRPIRGARDMLEALAVPRCVASSSSPDRIELALELTGLLPLLAPHIFSATMVKRGKPAPDLFLHAARQMAAEPGRCVVVEDSLAGVEAARAAGMRALGFAGGGHAGGAGFGEALLAAGAALVFTELPQLPGLIGEE